VELTRTEVDGIPALLAPAPGPLHAGLTFRVGRADEPLARAGITHLVEHLALHRLGLTDYHFNGATGTVGTHFHMSGDRAAVAGFLTGVCDALTDLPFDRLETEKSILRTEGAGRGAVATDRLAAVRYGATGFGVPGYDEWGVHQLTADDLREWVGTWFTAANAVLWISGGEIPAGLRLRLPPGERHELPDATPVLSTMPAYLSGPGAGVVFEAVVERGPAASLYSAVLKRELFRNLRQEGGYSYTAATAFDPVGQWAVLTAVADAHPDQQDAVLGGFVDCLMRHSVGTVEEDDLLAARAAAERALHHPEDLPAVLMRRASDLLTGYPLRPVAQRLARLRAVTRADLHAVAVAALESGLLLTPHGRTADWAGFAEVPSWTGTPVAGESLAVRDDPGLRAVIGPAGVSLVSPVGARTVRFDACAAVLAWPDGARHLIGVDGEWVRIEPTLLDVPPGILERLDRAVPPAVLVRMPSRDPSGIPRPRPVTAPAPAVSPPAPVAPVERDARETAMVALAVVFSIAAGIGLLGLMAVALDDTATAADWRTLGLVWTVALATGLPIVVVQRHRRSG
jgi:zinc protease